MAATKKSRLKSIWTESFHVLFEISYLSFHQQFRLFKHSLFPHQNYYPLGGRESSLFLLRLYAFVSDTMQPLCP
jgi:hypothetical protein